MPHDESRLVVFDSHSHLSSAPPRDSLPNYASVVVSVSESDWKRIGMMPGVTPGFGTHPWEAHSVEDGMEERLRIVLEADRKAIVGEIGLCRSARNARKNAHGWASQLDVFRAQLRIASDLDRPVSIHCVKAFKELFDIIDSVLDKSMHKNVALHSYSGTAHHLKGRDVYVGFSHAVNGDPRKKDKLQAVIRAVPSDRLLAESDLDDPRRAYRATRTAVCMIANARGWTHREAAERLDANARSWLRSGARPSSSSSSSS